MTSFLQLRGLPRPKLRALHTYGKMCRKGPGRSIQVYIVRHDIRSPARTEFSNLIRKLSQSCSARQELSERASLLDRTRRGSLRPDQCRPAASATKRVSATERHLLAHGVEVNSPWLPRARRDAMPSVPPWHSHFKSEDP